ncbi:MAG: SIMPL domain-containing protein, partial [Mycobacterium sp.]
MPSIRRARMTFGLVLASALAATSAACDSAPQRAGDNPRQVTVVGSGHVQGVPDTLTAEVGIEFIAPDVTAAMNQTNARQQAVIDALAGAGVDRKDINTTNVTLQPQFD